MAKERAILVSDGCGGCHAVKGILKPMLDDGTIREIKTSTEEGRAIAKELHLHSVPECIEMDNGKWSVCSLEDMLDEADERKEKDKAKSQTL
jgi:hypothetical protein